MGYSPIVTLEQTGSMRGSRSIMHAQDGSYHMYHSLPSSSRPDRETLKIFEIQGFITPLTICMNYVISSSFEQEYFQIRLEVFTYWCTQKSQGRCSIKVEHYVRNCVHHILVKICGVTSKVFVLQVCILLVIQ